MTRIADAGDINVAEHDRIAAEAEELNRQEGGMTMRQSDFIYKLTKKVIGGIPAEGFDCPGSAIAAAADCGATYIKGDGWHATKAQASALIDWLLGQTKK